MSEKPISFTVSGSGQKEPDLIQKETKVQAKQRAESLFIKFKRDFGIFTFPVIFVVAFFSMCFVEVLLVGSAYGCFVCWRAH